MRFAVFFLLAFSFLLLRPEAHSQSLAPPAVKRNGHIVELPAVNLKSRPKLPLQTALKIAEEYTGSQHIEMSGYWLSEARFILWGGTTPCWFFVWDNDNGKLGDYVEVIVNMDGRAGRVPSM